ncbi:hypothetical protein [Neolewinella antarctica]|uniref:Uncharacterized protein n=1 Tax=Neolewinella antarctica TaxID=442734 RepID=A0ABX0X8K9_9BACT|nr:hypothetical protein [Neolewinella antarctica]NJC25556.1 hypothetical protein [Neolewinella antarctica]
MSTQRFLKGVHEFFYTLLAFSRAWRFMWRHKLWEGLRQYGWVSRALLYIAIIVGVYMIGEMVNIVSEHYDEGVMQALFISSDNVFVRFTQAAYESLSDGALKWVILVLLEVVIYHFMRRSLVVILGKQVENAHLFKPFLRAQKRMLIVSFWALVIESASVGIITGSLPSVIGVPLSVLISSALLGFVIADNYNEQFHLSILQSSRNLWRSYVGICVGLGLPLFFMLKIPLLGAIVGPLVTSVTAAIVLRELSDLHLVGYQMSEKEQLKFDRRAAKRSRKEARKVARRNRRAGVKS